MDDRSAAAALAGSLLLCVGLGLGDHRPPPTLWSELRPGLVHRALRAGMRMRQTRESAATLGMVVVGLALVGVGVAGLVAAFRSDEPDAGAPAANEPETSASELAAPHGS